MRKLIASVLVLFMGITVSAQELQKATTKGAVRLFGDKDDLTTVITLIPAGSNVEIIKPDLEYTLVRFDNSEGFVKSDKLVTVQATTTVQPAANVPSTQATYSAQPQSQPQDRFEMLTMKYGNDIGKRLYQHKVWKGINADMARDSWGKPKQINRMYVDQSVDEEWIYSQKWLYFRDNILIEWGPVK
ncbi:MAG TPA: hypothetical protein VLQ76_02485 [Bacteroidales bacterium]|nr:hypothetical protein [Bacteroidales bacterium]